jgi:CBS domain-containing protein
MTAPVVPLLPRLEARAIICIEPTADLAAATKLLSIGVLVVLDAGRRLVGILSERDIVRTMADVGSAALQLPVAQVMTRSVPPLRRERFDQ